MGCTRCGPCGVMLAFLLLTMVIATNMLSWFPQWRQFKVFNTTSGSVWESYKLDVVEVPWVFYIHICVYNLQFLCLLYSSIATLCQPRSAKPQNQQVLQQSAVVLSYCLGLCGIVVWVAVRSMSSITAYSIIGIAAATVSFCVASLVGLRNSCRYKRPSIVVGLQGGSSSSIHKPKGPSPCVAMLPDALVYNALLGIATWTQALTMYSLAHLLQLHHIVQKDVAEYIAVGLIMAYLALWWSVDVFLTLSISSLVVTPYLLTACLFAMSLVRNFNLQNLHFITSSTFLCVCALLLLLKLCAVCNSKCSKKFSSNDKYVLHIEGRNGATPAVNGTLTSKDPKHPTAPHSSTMDRNQSRLHTNGSQPLPNGGLSGESPLLVPKAGDHQEEQHMVNPAKMIQPNESSLDSSIIKSSSGVPNGVPNGIPNGFQNGIQNGIQHGIQNEILQRPKSLPLQFVLPQTTAELSDGALTDMQGGLGVPTVKAITLPRKPSTQNGDAPGQGALVHKIRL